MRSRESMAMGGGITPVEGSRANFQEVECLAKFAVDDHNHNHRRQNSMLEFVKVVSAKQQVVAGTIYYITLAARDYAAHRRLKLYEAVVWVKPWIDFVELQRFTYLGDAAGLC